MIYLLHIDPPIGRAGHYLGNCSDDRLAERLREHARCKGAALTAAAYRAGSKIFLARTFEGLDHHYEQIMKRQGRFAQLCPLCCPVLHTLKSEVFEVRRDRPEQPPPRAVLDWRQ